MTMDEIEPASDELIANVEEGAYALIDAGHAQSPMPMADVLAIIARLRKAEAERGWQPIETAPHGEIVLLGWWQDNGLGAHDWQTELGAASFGWRRGSISNISRHSRSTHWMPLPAPPRATGGKADE
jgi:hypothetical protein